MDQQLTPEQERAKLIAELKALPIQPLKPLPPEIKAEILENQVPYEQAEQEYRELMEKGGFQMKPFLDEFERMLAENEKRG